MANQPAIGGSPETLHEFKASFYYGSRTDLLFKWLERLPDGEAAEYLQGALRLLADVIDSGDHSRLLQHIYRWNVRAYQPELDHHPFHWFYDDRPFVPPSRPAARSRIALLTSSGHFVQGHDPEPFGVKDMSQEEAARRIKEFGRSAPHLVEIPSNTPVDMLRVRHGGYDIRAAQEDPNVVFPIERLREFQQEGVIGEFASTAYSFVGASSQIKLKQEFAPRWAELLRARGIDGVLLVPV